MKWIIHYDISALAIMLVILSLMFYKKNFKTKSSYVYLLLLFVSILTSIMDIIGTYTISYSLKVNLGLNYFVNIFYLLLMNTISFIYYWYATTITRKKKNLRKHSIFLIKLLYFIDVVLIVSTNFSHFIFYFNDSRYYCAGSLKSILYIIALFMLILCMLEAIRYRSELNNMQRNAIYFFTLSNIVAVILQIIIPNLLITNFTIALALLLIYLTLQNPDTYLDSNTGAWNRLAFLDILSKYIGRARHFDVVMLKLEEFQSLHDIVGSRLSENLLSLVVNEIKKLTYRNEIYRISRTKFGIITENREKSEAIINTLLQRFDSGFKVDDIETLLHPVFCVVNYPEHGKSESELEYAAEFCLEKEKRALNQQVIYANSYTIKRINREISIIKIIERALLENKFIVYYQPIFSVTTGKFKCAEALLRLYDTELGFISPAEFIPLAEQSGQIIEIGEFVFEEVCKALSTNSDFQNEIEYIEINLSPTQCIQSNLRDVYSNVLLKYKLSPNLINLEITETAAISSNENLQKNIVEMQNDGISFSLDDYGTGFANINYLLQFPFSIVKIDKSLLWAAENHDDARIVLYHTVDMLKELNMKIVVEGVETKEQADMLSSIGCDYIQGFYYAKPMPLKDLLGFLQSTSNI